MRRKLFDILEVKNEDSKASRFYNLLMLCAIILSILPLTTKEENDITEVIDIFTMILFVIDYILRLATADIKYNKGAISFIKYPFSLMAIIDLLSILPSLAFLGMNKGFRMLKLFRLLRTLKVVRIFKTFRYSKNIVIIYNVLKKAKDNLITVASLALAYIFITALIVFNVEPETFDNFGVAIYWASISLTTVGYGDVYCVSTVGKFFTIVSAFIGIGIVALPTGIISGAFMEVLADKKQQEEKE